ncbi:MAG TPA: proline--tRNA ligase [Nanoarchaeota archaeon]|nr:proline--tRNA ligase [Candidatus Woesearchaeota archaeon]HIH15640.1 proline--tRNA ligase [Nanoarchaeota archaeon]HIH58461.1 proline--tRNA ligase [Nanoarchaeota archaeon]HII13608.1 proline--tRNA ligase [Nanoarchaeota archaeon]HIJ04529.1 proline--tRNA ligase [Nanoarchaeota archaeon]
MAETQGITAKKDQDHSEWFTQVIQKAGLIEYTDVSGCYILRPYAYEIWETIQKYFDQKIKEKGVKNTYFPLFIPESLLKKESAHVAGFTPEVAWVTHAGEEKLSERLAIRPTSETIIYAAFSKWIRSHNDLPLKINQWCSVVRWEFRNPTPFLRSREFLWQEGHTAYAKKEEADAEVLDILDLYAEIFEELYAVPITKGQKSEKETFAGALYTTSVETFLPVGKGIQGATSHCLGQNFAKAFDITFLDEKGEKQYVWQNSWGITTRSIGMMILMHGDDKGLILPPRIAPIQIVIIPILFDNTKKEVVKKCEEIEKKLKEYKVHFDEREEYTPGFKYNEWELKGVPLRLELGPKDLEKKQIVVVRRDTGKKEFVLIKDIEQKIPELLEDIQKSLFQKAEAGIKSNTIEVNSFTEFKKAIQNKKRVKAIWCTKESCEEKIKESTEGAKSLNIPFNQKKIKGKCFHCGEPADSFAYFGKSY